jgi:hypothetical protein
LDFNNLGKAQRQFNQQKSRDVGNGAIGFGESALRRLLEPDILAQTRFKDSGAG